MDFSKYSLAIALAVAALAAVCYSAEVEKEKTVNCYQCQSNKTNWKLGLDDPCITGKNLSETMDNVTCTGKNAVCMKVFSHIYGMSDGDTDWSKYPPVVSRFCATTHPLMDIGCAGSEGIKGKQKYCLCDDNFCNSAARPVGLLAAAVSSLIAFLLVRV